MNGWEPAILSVAGISFVVSGWLFMSWGTARRSGWRSLANRFPVSDHAESKIYRFQRISIGRWSYLVTVALSSRAVTLKQAIPHLLFHPAITIPFNTIRQAERRGVFPLARLGICVDDFDILIFGSVRDDPVWERFEEPEV